MYLKEEIRAEALVRNLPGFLRFLPIAALFHGQVVNVSGVARDAATPRTTVGGYLDILEDTRSHEISFRAQKLFCNAGPNLKRSGQILALHDLLDDERRGDVDRLTGIVSLAVSRSAGDHRRAARDARHL